MTKHKLARVLMVLAASVVVVQATPASARPVRGSPEFVVVLCEPSDPDAPHTGLPLPAQRPRPSIDDVRRRLLTRGGDSFADFLNDWSYGLADTGRARIFGWYSLPLTRAEWQALPRLDMAERCADAARQDPAWLSNPPSDPITVLVGHPMIDLFGSSRLAYAFVPQDFDIGNSTHEIGHALGLEHAQGKVLTGQSAGHISEYGDPWDVMAWANNYAVSTAHGVGPAGLSAPNMEYLGWLPSTRIVTHGADGRQSAKYCLAPLNDPLRPGWLMVRASLSDTDPFVHLTVEYRNISGWGSGIPPQVGGQVRILQVNRAVTTLLYELEPPADQPWLPATDVTMGDLRIRVLAKDPAGCGAQVLIEDQQAITSDRLSYLQGQLGPNRCAAGYVPRKLDPYDYVCTTEAVRRMHYREGSVWPPTGSGTTPLCSHGTVTRNAFAGDSVCVSQSSADQAATDNREASKRFELQ